MKKLILNESDKKAIISAKEKAIIESFAKTFNSIKRIDENEINEETPQVAVAAAQSPNPPNPPKNDNNNDEKSMRELIFNLHLGKWVVLDKTPEENKNQFDMLKMTNVKTISNFGPMNSEYYGKPVGYGESFVGISELEDLKFFIFKIEVINNGNQILIHRDMNGDLKEYIPNFILLKISGNFAATKDEDGFASCQDIYRGSCVRLNQQK
jgi:hypothetical protein